ncbi:hypothetical protein M2169_002904 [Streptomyces sp. MJP52]|nr:hypothetical protein [Streptomyces sp. MJP52]
MDRMPRTRRGLWTNPGSGFQRTPVRVNGQLGNAPVSTTGCSPLSLVFR